MKKRKKIAVFHPWIKSRGGAEKVVLEILKRLNHDVKIYTWFYDPDKTFDEFRKYDVRVISPGISRVFSRSYLLRSMFLPLGILKKIPLEDYDLFLISTSGVGEFITFRNYLPKKTVAYVHTPLRDVDPPIIEWNLKNKYQKRKLSKLIYLFATKIYRYLEKRAWKKLDVIIFNSEISEKRAKNRNLIQNKQTKIIYPPIKFPKSSLNKSKINREDYFIYISRLNPPKRQDVLIKAWRKFVKEFPKMELVIVGTSENKKYLKKLRTLSEETKNVTIKTDVEDDELANLLHNSKAGLFLGYLEDFGMTPLNVIYSNKPLIAVNEGGYVSIIKNHPLFYEIEEKHDNDLMVDEIAKALKKFMNTKTKKSSKKPNIPEFATDLNKFISSLD